MSESEFDWSFAESQLIIDRISTSLRLDHNINYSFLNNVSVEPSFTEFFIT